MSAAIISGVFAVLLACLAWGLQNGSRRARLLSRIERYTQILKDLPYGHPARAHLDAALAAEAAQLRDLTGSQALPYPTPGYQPPAYAPAPLPNGPYGPYDPGPATMDDIFGRGPATRPGSPSTRPSPSPAAPSPGPTPAPAPGPSPAPAPGPTPAPALPPEPAPTPAPGPAPMPAPATEPKLGPPMRAPARSPRSLQTYASLALGLLAGGFAIFAIWLAIDQLLR